MPPCIREFDAESGNLSDELHKERIPTTPHRQMLVGVETPTHYNSDNNNDNGDETHYNINTISKLSPKVLKGMLIELTKCNKVRNSNTYKKPSHHSDFHQRLSRIHNALKEAPMLMTKNWYAWNPRFRGILSNWPAAMKHLDSTVALEDKKLKKDLTKMEKIVELTLLNKVRKICMFQANVQKLIADINKHWAKAKSMGHTLPEILKVRTLIDQARYITSYHHCIITLEDTVMVLNYKVLCATLFKHQDCMTAQTDHRTSDLKSAQANLAEGQVRNEEAYHRGKPGPDSI
ncbi:uncharacterized protein UBRO_20983 [Ustilago bromivora]|uniref:Uncharacterized protein n=1 Tax=Ustilago bromivora TaxID=307758 RepID=A0A1K0GEC6_9BASI|nr:uncharacterized protein UBRO_20983 [Ustilago bromivora]